MNPMENSRGDLTRPCRERLEKKASEVKRAFRNGFSSQFGPPGGPRRIAAISSTRAWGGFS